MSGVGEKERIISHTNYEKENERNVAKMRERENNKPPHSVAVSADVFIEIPKRDSDRHVAKGDDVSLDRP